MQPVTANVSVVIPAFKAAATIARSVESCLGDAAVRDIIVVIDGPDAVLQGAVPDDDRVTIIVNAATLGACATRNIGLGAARGDHVLFLDADDYVESGLIGGMAVAGLGAKADVVFGPYAFELASGRRIDVGIDKHIGMPGTASVLKAWFAGNYVPCCSVLWRTGFMRDIGGWDETFLKNQDGELMWRACRHNPVMAHSTTGRGIYVQSASATRVSATVSAAALRQQIDFFSHVERELSAQELRALAGDIGAMYYRLARLAYYNGLAEIGTAAERAARRRGFQDHGGSALHRAAARLLGLRIKEQLCVRLHRAERALGVLRVR